MRTKGAGTQNPCSAPPPTPHPQQWAVRAKGVGTQMPCSRDTCTPLSPGRDLAAIVGGPAWRQRALRFPAGGAEPAGSDGGWGGVQPPLVSAGPHHRGQYADHVTPTAANHYVLAVVCYVQGHCTTLLRS